LGTQIALGKRPSELLTGSLTLPAHPTRATVVHKNLASRLFNLLPHQPPDIPVLVDEGHQTSCSPLLLRMRHQIQGRAPPAFPTAPQHHAELPLWLINQETDWQSRVSLLGGVQQVTPALSNSLSPSGAVLAAVTLGNLDALFEEFPPLPATSSPPPALGAHGYGPPWIWPYDELLSLEGVQNAVSNYLDSTANWPATATTVAADMESNMFPLLDPFPASATHGSHYLAVPEGSGHQSLPVYEVDSSPMSYEFTTSPAWRRSDYPQYVPSHASQSSPLSDSNSETALSRTNSNSLNNYAGSTPSGAFHSLHFLNTSVNSGVCWPSLN
jgi:hypothetical protein